MLPITLVEAQNGEGEGYRLVHGFIGTCHHKTVCMHLNLLLRALESRQNVCLMEKRLSTKGTMNSAEA